MSLCVSESLVVDVSVDEQKDKGMPKKKKKPNTHSLLADSPYNNNNNNNNNIKGHCRRTHKERRVEMGFLLLLLCFRC